MFCDVNEIAKKSVIAFRPVKRVTVAEGAAQTLYLNQPGGYTGPWSPTETPYMVEPMNKLASRRHEAVCFVGPARTGKTLGLLDAWFAHAVACDPGDMLIIQMSQEKAREYSKVRVDRAIRYSPVLHDLMSSRANDDNTHDKLFKNGMWLKIGWPSASQMSSSDYRYVALTDYDRFPDNIDGEGAAYGLALKRTQTFLSRGMCMVESSPGREITDPHWRPATAHEAPPCTGVLGIYNRSDRNRWHWKCPECSDWFEAKPGLELFATLPSHEELCDIVRKDNLNRLAAKHAIIACPHCGVLLDKEHKNTMNQGGLWVPEGCRIIDDEVTGEAHHSSVAGYWLGGVAAAYQHWNSLILRYLQGLREYVTTGSEETLKTTINTDQGMPYLSQHLKEIAEDAMADSVEEMERFIVPPEARFLVAAVDVQGGSKGRFVCQVHAVGPNLEMWLIDRFEITKSPRGESVQIDPAAYPEDWDEITRKLITSTYLTKDGKELRIKMTAVDSGGESGTTANAYAWLRRVKKLGHGGRAMLVKGAASKPQSPVTQGTARDSKGKPIKDILLHMVDTDYFKDLVNASLRRKTSGAGAMHLPDWLQSSFFDELKAEVRLPSGKWKKIRSRNEALDLWVYCLVACWHLGANKIKWDRPPVWAKPIDSNSEVIAAEVRRELKETVPILETPQPKRKVKFGARSSIQTSDEWASKL